MPARRTGPRWRSRRPRRIRGSARSGSRPAGARSARRGAAAPAARVARSRGGDTMKSSVQHVGQRRPHDQRTARAARGSGSGSAGTRAADVPTWSKLYSAPGVYFRAPGRLELTRRRRSGSSRARIGHRVEDERPLREGVLSRFEPRRPGDDAHPGADVADSTVAMPTMISVFGIAAQLVDHRLVGVEARAQVAVNCRRRSAGTARLALVEAAVLDDRLELLVDARARTGPGSGRRRRGSGRS